MSLLRRATDQTQSEWLPVPEGLWRWLVGVPELKLSEKYGNYQVKFPLQLGLQEQKRLLEEIGKPPDGMQQSWRTGYTVGLSLGYVQRDGQYKSTKLVDFLAACLGSGNTKKFREWIAQGGGPPRPADLNSQQDELEAIHEWLKWWEGLEVYGTIAHRTGEGDQVFANFAGPMPVGSLPGQKDNDYDALGRGKLRAIIAESGETRESNARGQRVAVAERPPAQRYTSDGTPATNSELDDLPF
jgi:hypothetical protein